MRDFKVRDFKVRDFKVRDFKVKDFKVRDFKMSDFRFWTRKSLTLQLVFWKSLGYSVTRVTQFWKVSPSLTQGASAKSFHVIRLIHEELRIWNFKIFALINKCWCILGCQWYSELLISTTQMNAYNWLSQSTTLKLTQSFRKTCSHPKG